MSAVTEFFATGLRLNYFKSQNLPNTAGLTYHYTSGSKTIGDGKVSLAKAGCAVCFPHELGHTYGAPDRGLEFVADGYDALNKTKKIGKISLMGADAMSVLSIDGAWIKAEDYSIWLGNAVKDVVDPKIVYLAGMLSKDGQFSVISSGVGEGYLTDDLGGDLSVEGVDEAGKTVQHISVSSTIAFDSTALDGTLDTRAISSDYTPVVVSMPYNSSIKALVVKKSNAQIIKVQVASLNLSEIVRLIPQGAYKFNPFASQFVLQLQADFIQRAIDKKANPKEIVRLINLFEAEVMIGLRDQYKISTPGQLVKPDVLKAIEAVKDGVH